MDEGKCSRTRFLIAMSTSEYSPEEMMTVAAARALRNEDICFVGIGAPSSACNLARLTHAPGITLIYESGTLDARPSVLPLSIGDEDLCSTALTTVSVPEIFKYWLQGGRITVGFLGGAQIDRYANLNTTVIGHYESPRVRLPGGGGAPEIAVHCRQTYIIMRHSRRGFVPKVEFITSLGHGDGHESRTRAGARTLGPTRVFTELCILEPHPETKELVVVSIHAGVTRERIAANTGWPVRFASELPDTPAPSVEELATLRELKRRSRVDRA